MHQLRKNAGTIVVAAVVALFTVIVTQPSLLRASQNTLGLATTGVFSGLTEQNAINNAIDALLTCNSGSSAPVNALGGSPKEGQCWLDTTSSTLKIKKRYSGSGWVVEGVIDVTNGIWIPAAGGGTGSAAAASTTDLCASPQQFQTVSGTTTITSFGSSCVVGARRTLLFSGIVTITYNATSLIEPGSVSYTTAAGDIVEAVYTGSGNWRVTAINRLNGQAVINPAVAPGSMVMTVAAAADAKYVFGFGQAISRTSFPDYFAAVSRVQTGTTTATNPTATSVADTSGMGAGMPIEGTCYPANTTIASVTGSTITASANASTNGACTLTVVFTGYGSGGTSSTVGVPDCRGRLIAGRDDMGGTAASRLTSASTGFNANGTQIGASGGSQSHTLTVAELAVHNHPVFLNDPQHSHGYTLAQAAYTAAGGGTSNAVNLIGGTTTSVSTGITVRDTSGGGGTANQTATNGSSTAHSVVNPLMIANCQVRVLAFAFPPANDNRAIVRGREPVAIARRLA